MDDDPDYGEGGEPGGPPGPSTTAQARRRAQSHADDAVRLIIGVARGGGRNSLARLAAARMILEVAFDDRFRCEAMEEPIPTNEDSLALAEAELSGGVTH